MRLQFRRKETEERERERERHLSLDNGEKNGKKKNENVGLSGPISFRFTCFLISITYLKLLIQQRVSRG